MTPPIREQILRYPGPPSHVLTRRDPLDDLCAWTRGLRSFEYTSDILRQNHKAVIELEVEGATRAIAAHAENAVDYLEQAHSGPADVSFLPLYYALLNLAKIYIIASGRMSELREQKWHGASYVTDRADSQRQLADEQILIKPTGTIPLFYEVLAASRCPSASSRDDGILPMGSVFPRVRFVSTEYREAYPAAKYPFAGFTTQLAEADGGYRLRVVVTQHKDRGEEVLPETIHLFDGGTYVRTETGIEHEGPIEIRDRATAFERGAARIRRQLVSSHYDATQRRFSTFTPVGIGPWLWPEEFSILLSFYHLSNVVRYDPEYLERLKDSKSWLFLYALRSNGPLTFLELFWSFIKRRTLVLRRL